MTDKKSEASAKPSEDSELISKSQRKREMQELRLLGEKLVQLNDEQLIPLSSAVIIKAVRDCRKITKGNARKRQIQYIAKLLRNIQFDDIRKVIDRYDASSKTHARQFHQLEKWREQLITGDYSAIDEIATTYKAIDRQQLKQLTRKAIHERLKITNEQFDGPPTHYRRLFQYLKSLADSA
ncbi:MAG: DUF615 domain-containing protein [Proteobacteria bacterium]|nr:DUF615 domain-containing protein [Pseudomonadota bacterium]